MTDVDTQKAIAHLQDTVRALNDLIARGDAFVDHLHDTRQSVRDAIHALGGDSFFDD